MNLSAKRQLNRHLYRASVRTAACGTVLLVGAALLSGCAADKISTALASPPGQLFCAIQTGGGGTIVAGLINAEVTQAAPDAAPIAVLATGATKSAVDKACAAAGGIPVSPPANPAAAPQIAIPASATPAAPALTG